MLPRIVFVLACSVVLYSQNAAQKTSDKDAAQQKARAVIERSIEAMGGDAFRQVREMQSKGNYYIFKDGQTAGIAKYLDFTRLPDKSRNQLGEGKNKEVTIFDLSANKGWHMEGKSAIKEAKPEEVKQFRQTVRHAIENLLRGRLSEPGMTFFYYTPDEISGKGDVEAVEMIDSENDTVSIYFDVKTHLPTRLEYVAIDPRGNKHKEATEFYVWLAIQGIMTPMRFDNYSDGQLASQIFVKEMIYNPKPPIPDSYFAQPVAEK
ncbi:MAG TPA: hypothetical protein VGL91_01945 [Acidobacteriota bacterium]|jgi:hypothetical protein